MPGASKGGEPGGAVQGTVRSPPVSGFRAGVSKGDDHIREPVAWALQAEDDDEPMPTPEHLGQYDKIVRGAARIIVHEFEANSRHAREMDLLGLRGMMAKDARAQWIAAALVVIGFVLIYQLATMGHDTVAISVAAGLLGTVVTAFLTGTLKAGRPAGIERAGQQSEPGSIGR